MIARVAIFAAAITASAQTPVLPQQYADVARFLSIERDVELLLTPACAIPEDSMACLGARSRVVSGILLAQLEVSTVASLIEREEERARQRADTMTRRLTGRVRKMTVGLILIGAAGVILSVALSSDTIAITTAAVETALGVTTLLQSAKEQFDHASNPLREIWLEDRSAAIFPPGLRYYMERPASDGVRTIRQELIEGWMQSYEIGQPTPEGQRLKSLLLGEGGIYTPDDLRVRASMLSQLHGTLLGVEERLVRFQKNLLRSREAPGETIK